MAEREKRYAADSVKWSKKMLHVTSYVRIVLPFREGHRPALGQNENWVLLPVPHRRNILSTLSRCGCAVGGLSRAKGGGV